MMLYVLTWLETAKATPLENSKKQIKNYLRDKK